MKNAHVTEDEIRAGMRQQGFSSVEDVGLVVLEGNGKIIAVKKGNASTLA